MPIIRSSRRYLCCYRIWCVMPWLLVVGGQVQVCPTPERRPPAAKAFHTIHVCSNNTSIVSSPWWLAYKCPNHVQKITSAIYHSVVSSCFFSKITQECKDQNTSNPIIWSSAFRFYTYLVLLDTVTWELGSIFYVQKNTTYKKALHYLFPPHVSAYLVGRYQLVV